MRRSPPISLVPARVDGELADPAPSPIGEEEKTTTEKQTVQITLTPRQQEELRQATGKQVQSLKLEALEVRLSPGISAN
jgi:hypothetical protein